MSEKQRLCLSIHLPFAQTMCLADGERRVLGASAKTRMAYMDALTREAIAAAADCADYEIDKIHVHGASQCISPVRLFRLIETVRGSFSMCKHPAFIIDCDPCDFDVPTLVYYKEMGMTLLNLRLYSAVKCENEAIERVRAHYALSDIMPFIRDCAIGEVGAIVSYGLPLQCEDTLIETLEACNQYTLCVLTLCSFDGQTPIPRYAVDYLASKGYVRENNRFVLSGHGTMTEEAQTLALGAGGVSVMNGVKARMTSDMDRYIADAGDVTKILEEATLI